MKTIFVALVLLTASVVAALNEKPQDDLLSVVAEREGIDIRALRAVVDAPEGAETPEKAIEMYSQAATAGDVVDVDVGVVVDVVDVVDVVEVVVVAGATST